MSQDMALILAEARNSDTVKALAAGSNAMDAMAGGPDVVGADAFAAAAGALADAFSIIKAAHLAAHPHLTHAMSVHQAKLTGRA